MSNIDYTLWHNTDSTLGQNKVAIPDGVTTFWPEGDALVGNFVYDKGHLVGFVDTKALVANESKSTTFPYDYVNIQVDKSLEGVMTFNAGERTKYFTVTYTESGNSGDTIMFKYKGCKTVDEVKAVDPDYKTNDIVDGVWTESLSSLTTAHLMFYNCTALTAFTGDLSSLTNGLEMFYNCSNLTTFTSDLSSLANGSAMFRWCDNLTSFSSDLSSLTNGSYMFDYCHKLTSFTSDLGSLTDGDRMFYCCTALSNFNTSLGRLTNGSEMFCECNVFTTFNYDLSSLTNGDYMFSYCSKLENFTSDLSSLTSGYNMFYNCKLDVASVQNIADTINTVQGNSIHIGCKGYNSNSELEVFFQQIREKGWNLSVSFNGESSTCGCGCGSCNSCYSLATTDETGEVQKAPMPFYAKPVPAEEERARYIDSEGNFFNILGGNLIYVDDPETYGMFTSIEDAAAQMRLTKIGEDIQTA